MIIITNYTVVHLVGICILFRKSIVSLYSKVAGNFMQEAQNDLSSNHGYLKYLFKRAFEKYDSESTQCCKSSKQCKKELPPFLGSCNEINEIILKTYFCNYIDAQYIFIIHNIILNYLAPDFLLLKIKEQEIRKKNVFFTQFLCMGVKLKKQTFILEFF